MYAIRRVVAHHAGALGFSAARGEDAILAVNEVMTNSVRYGGASGTVALWHQGRTLVCEVRDHGRIEQVLAGRIRPPHAQAGGHGLWIVNQLCDLVQIRCDASGTTVRLFISRHGHDSVCASPTRQGPGVVPGPR
jgi:anti-sigma regulatory factor (Ser/Thr protein kinase)